MQPSQDHSPWPKRLMISGIIIGFLGIILLSFIFDDLDDYLTTLSKNFENVSIEELKSITNEILSEKTNENFEEKINSIV